MSLNHPTILGAGGLRKEHRYAVLSVLIVASSTTVALGSVELEAMREAV